MTFLSHIFLTLMVTQQEKVIPEELLHIYNNYILKIVPILKKSNLLYTFLGDISVSLSVKF
jgi:hypothetical protein